MEKLNNNEVELLIFKGIYSNLEFRKEIFRNFKKKYFDDPHARKIFEIIKNHYEEFDVTPSLTELFLKVEAEEKEGVKAFLTEVLRTKISSTEHLGIEAERYIKEKSLKTSIITAIDMVDVDPTKALQYIIDNAAGVSLNGYNKKYSFNMPYNGYTFQERDDIPDKQYWLYPLIPKGGHLSLWAGEKGCGKSMLALKLCDTICKNDDFYVWKGTEGEFVCPSAARVLYLDGEMSPQEMLLRTKMFEMNDNFFPYQFRDINNTDKKAALTDSEYRDFLLERIVEHKYQVVIIDNIASLFVGLDENSAKDWSTANQWLLDLRMNNVSVILIHHMGKDSKAGARGTTHHYDNVDDTVYLTRPKGYDQADGIKFWMKFEHFRSYVPFEVREELIGNKLISYNEGQWSFGKSDEAEEEIPTLYFNAMKILMRDINIRKMDIRDRLNLGKNHRIIDELIENGYIETSGYGRAETRTITPLGNEWYLAKQKIFEMGE